MSPRSYGTTGVQQLSTAPAVGTAGSLYYNTTTSQLYVSTGSVWAVIGGSADPLIVGEVRTTKLDYNPAGTGDITLGVSFNMNGQKIYGMATPVNPDHAVTKAYVDGLISSDTPWGTLGYAQITSNSANTSNSATLVDTAGLATTVTVGAGRRIKITASVGTACTVASDRAQVAIREGSTSLKLYNTGQQVTINTVYSAEFSVVLTPSAGSHTYKISLARYSGTGTNNLMAGVAYPAYILVEDIGV